MFSKKWIFLSVNHHVNFQTPWIPQDSFFPPVWIIWIFLKSEVTNTCWLFLGRIVVSLFINSDGKVQITPLILRQDALSDNLLPFKNIKDLSANWIYWMKSWHLINWTAMKVKVFCGNARFHCSFHTVQSKPNLSWHIQFRVFRKCSC